MPIKYSETLHLRRKILNVLKYKPDTRKKNNTDTDMVLLKKIMHFLDIDYLFFYFIFHDVNAAHQIKKPTTTTKYKTKQRQLSAANVKGVDHLFLAGFTGVKTHTRANFGVKKA